MNKIEKSDSRSLKREKLKSFLSERRSQKCAQATAKKETARRLILERRARLVSERTYARQRKEALKETKIKSRIKINAEKSDKIASLSRRSKSEKRKVLAGEKTKLVSGEEEAKPSFSAPVKNRQAENRQKLLAYLEKQRVNKSEIIAGKIRQKEAAAEEKRARRAELKRQKQSRRQTKPIIQAQEKSGETIPAAIGQSYKRQQLLLYLKKRKSGGKAFAVQRRELKKITEAVVPEAISVPMVPEAAPVVIPLVTPSPVPLTTEEAVPEKVLAPIEEKPPARRLKLFLARGKKPSQVDAELAVAPKPELPARKPFRIVPFLKGHFVKIILLLLVLAWFIEIALLNKHLENIRQQLEQTASIARSHVSGEAVITAKTLPPAVATTRVEGIRDPFSSELWRIQEITPAQARAVGVRPVRMPEPPSIIKPITPILIAQPPKPPEFMPPEVARAIPESAKLARIPEITVPEAGSVSAPSAPASSLRFRGILNVAGIDYFFVEGAGGGYRVRVGDTVEGFKIYDYRNGVLYFAKDGYTYQLNEEKVSPPLRYRGRMIMAGQEYFFLEGQRTYRTVIGEEIEGYRLVKRVGDYLYFVKDDRLYYLKQE
ncbi:MAG: hypothetical protein ABII89_02170 [Candidatus Omnitrophota bacterium]